MIKMWESQVSWREKKPQHKSKQCVIDTNKDANSIFILDAMNGLGALMQYSYPLQKMFWPINPLPAGQDTIRSGSYFQKIAV